MIQDITLLTSGLVFGLSAGLSPGPLMTLVATETLKHGAREGVKVALAPLLTDLPIVLAALFVVSSVARLDTVLGVIALLGGAYLAYLGWESLSIRAVDPQAPAEPPRSLRKGVIANFLNPSPYLFWFTIGAPLVLKAHGVSTLHVVLFLGEFYICLVGSKVAFALVLGKARSFLKSGWYVATLRVLGLLLLLFAVLFVKEGLTSLGAL